MGSKLLEILNQARRLLLDLSCRNRLLSIPLKTGRFVNVYDEQASEVFRLLVSEKKALSFLPGKQKEQDGQDKEGDVEADEEIGLPIPNEDEDELNGTAKRHVDLRLQTALSPEGLQRRLIDLYRDSEAMIEEQGVNVLYLALGQLKWFESESSDIERFAPLILVPVELSRRTVSDRLILRWREEEILQNYSLSEKLLAEFGITLPSFPDEESLVPAEYFASVARVVESAKRWEVLPDAITLGFFSFAKFLMYRDLNPESWPGEKKIHGHPLITGLLQDGFAVKGDPIPDNANLDELISVDRLDHVVDADSSQAIAIETVRKNQLLVIQGPPGTGKSQSITNIITTAVMDGKKVLFVAEKLAALEVVKRRMEREGLGDLCLELHSNKTSKRAVINEIGRTWQLTRPDMAKLESILPKLERLRSVLSMHSNTLHEPYGNTNVSAFRAMGALSALPDVPSEYSRLSLPDAPEWNADVAALRRSLLQQVVSRIEHIGPPCQHLWRGVRRETVLQIDLTGIRDVIARMNEHLQTLLAEAGRLASMIKQDVPDSTTEVESYCVIAEFMAKAPEYLDRSAIKNPAWDTDGDKIIKLVASLQRYKELRNVEPLVVDDAWQKDFSDVRGPVASHGTSFFRFLNGSYRRSVATLRGALKNPSTKLPRNLLGRVDQIIEGQRILKEITANEEYGRAVFGSNWQGADSDCEKLHAIIQWVDEQQAVGLDADFREVFAVVQERPEALRSTVDSVRAKAAAFCAARSVVEAELRLDWQESFNVIQQEDVPLSMLRDRGATWLIRLDSLSEWNSYYLLRRDAIENGLSPIVTELDSGRLTPKVAGAVFDHAYYAEIFRRIVKDKPNIARFDGALHNTHVNDFKEMDKSRLTLAKYRVLHAHFSKMPAFVGVGPSGILRGEMERQRGHRPVRRLLKDCGSVIQAIKPVFMMSPLSVAQFLEAGAVEFDLLVIDEASQVQPVDALGAVARSKQIVVVGDSKQLPPTRFFQRMTNGSEEEDEEIPQDIVQAGDMESILGLCLARGIPSKMLRWHYRSRHHTLIAVSNHEFYEDRLFIVPSPHSAAAGLGLKFNHVPDGVFERGRAAVNRVEARVVAKAVIEHARKTPQLSLGVAAFSIKQRQAILDELELLRREHPDLEGFFYGHESEPFFVKNLENVQGDERDVIFLSVGYGPDENGYMAMTFGALNAEGGERRLNVLISRAKTRCEVFSSITEDQIDLERAPGRGVAALKAFLSFARTGRMSLAAPSGKLEQSPLEESIRRAVESLGYEVHSQVGIAGFFIDLAVVDRELHGRYILGIECDGASYHSSRSARERDRLRQAVLENHGWIIHRVWSTDWFQRRTDELRKIQSAIQKAKNIAQSEEVTAAPIVSVKVSASDDAGISREVLAISKDERSSELTAVIYEEAKFAVPKKEIHLLSPRELGDIVHRIVSIEGPIHEDEVVVRIRGLWGLSRAGARIQSAVGNSVHTLLTQKRCVRSNGFLSIPGAPVKPRSRVSTSSSTLRKPEYLPPPEVQEAIMVFVDAGHGARREELPSAVARFLGFSVTGPALRELIDSQIDLLLSGGKLILQGDWLQKTIKK